MSKTFSRRLCTHSKCLEVHFHAYTDPEEISICSAWNCEAVICTLIPVRSFSTRTTTNSNSI